MGYLFARKDKPPVDESKPGVMVLESLGIRVLIDRKNKQIAYGGASAGPVSPKELIGLGQFLINVGGMAGALEDFPAKEIPNPPTLDAPFPERMDFCEKTFRYWLESFQTEEDVLRELLLRKIRVEQSTVSGVRLLDFLCAHAFKIVMIPGVMFRRIVLGFEGCEFQSPEGFTEFLNGKLKNDRRLYREVK